MSKQSGMEAGQAELNSGSCSVERHVGHECHECHDCKKRGNWPLLMNTTVVGDMQYLCPDCLEENDPDGVMQSPCPQCGGSGREWEGWNCEYCDGTGTDDF